MQKMLRRLWQQYKCNKEYDWQCDEQFRHEEIVQVRASRKCAQNASRQTQHHQRAETSPYSVCDKRYSLITKIEKKKIRVTFSSFTCDQRFPPQITVYKCTCHHQLSRPIYDLRTNDELQSPAARISTTTEDDKMKRKPKIND